MRLIFFVMCVVWASGVRAELQSLFPRNEVAVATAQGSLFAGAQAGLFARPERAALPTTNARFVAPRSTGSTPVDQLLSLIAEAEAGSKGYDAVQYGARIRPALPPTQMTLGDIYAWIDATPGQPHAIGRYQFIPPTLRRVAQIRGFGPETPFTPGVQDALAVVLLEDAGLSAFKAGDMDRLVFMHNLAKIWAGLPLPNGRSYYEGYAGNSASMSWAVFDGGMRAIWGV
ncbi:lysozyme family protein [Pseudooctadecabacter jejudonensis]|uniref:Transglycosylase SLT domain-containing protein n=1 Tax=Pseudooctadecabacter jejudonensis TaxID=1391910 RepID=A0A1Y5S0D1_9RHOB|nr:hypothetical protein [Pseudooctadecabacter jejudonensis]SLN28321.1 hypothetical protein PSJ8397_01185 [Pseudooctadecabacter jejudonensis]